MKKNQNSGLVYSTEFGKMCPSCSKPVKECVCKSNKKPAEKVDGIVRVSRESKGRKGAGVTLITGIQATEEKLKELTTLLKKKCGAGGALKGSIIEIQGEHRDRLVIELEKLGYRAKKAGG